MSENITDKELLAICNLSNLKMEFANLVKQTVQSGTETIYTNHTIYSLLEKELNVIKIKEKYKNILAKQIPNGNLENLKEIHSNFGENMNSNTKELLLEQNSLRSEEIICRKELDKVKKDISFYNISKDNKQVPIYSCKEELQKEAPIVMEYYDRYSKVNRSDKVDKNEKLKHEGAFLDEWEVVYGGDFYEILLDYYILTKSNFAKKESNTENNTNEGMSIITSPTAKYDFKIKEGFIFRESINLEKEFSGKINFGFDLLTSLLPAREFREFVFVNSNYTKTSLLKKLFVLSKPLTKTTTTKTIFENANNNNIIDIFLKLCVHKDNKTEILGALNVNISLDIIDIKIVIVKKKYSNDFIVAFKSSDSNKIIQDLKKGVLNLDLLTFNALIETVIKSSVNNNSEINVHFTGYGSGAVLATACFLMNNSISNIEENSNENQIGSNFSENDNIFKINYYNRAFIGIEKPNFLELINFNVYDLEYVAPGSFSYSPNFQEDIKNFFSSVLTNMCLTDNIGLVAAILLKRSLFRGIYSAFIGVGTPVYVTLIIIYFVYSYFNRLRLNNIESRFKENDILLKTTKGYNKINAELFDYNSIMNSYSQIDLIKENIFEYDNKFIFEPIISEYIDKIFIEIETNKQKMKNNKNDMKLVAFKLNDKKIIYIPFIVAIKLIFSNILLYEKIILPINEGHNFISLYHKDTIIFGQNYENLYFLKLDSENNFIGIIKKSCQENHYPAFSKYCHIKSPTFSFEKMVILALNVVFTAQAKYSEAADEILGSEFIYFNDCSSKEDKPIFYNLEQQFYQEKKVKLTDTEKEKTLKMDKLEENYLQSKDIVPNRTKKLFQIKGFGDNNNIYHIGLPYSEFIYFPYLDKNGTIIAKIREDYIGTVLRSLYREKIKYETLDVDEDAEYDGYFLTGEFKEKNSRLNSCFIQHLKTEGKTICYPEHYNSMMELLKENPSLIEKYYDIKMIAEHVKKENIKFGILNENGEYAEEKIGFIYNDDKLYGRAVDLIYYYLEEKSFEDITTFGVCDGATLECTCGSALSKLEVESQKTESTDDCLDATEKDKKMEKFGKCSITDSSCSPEPMNWEGVSKGSAIGGNKCLISTSTIGCKKGGMILIKDPKCKLRNN